MIEHLHYDFDDDTNLVLDTPQSVYEQAMSETKLGAVLDHSAHLVRAEQGEGVRFLFDAKQFEALRGTSNEQTEEAAKHWLYTLYAVKSVTPDELGDPELNVHMSLNPLPDASDQARRGMSAEIKWPLGDDDAVSRFATIALRRAALNFGYLKRNIINAAYARVAEDRGAEFQAFDIACSCLTTDNLEYRLDESKAELYGHNLYNRQLQLTLLHGLVAAVRSK